MVVLTHLISPAEFGAVAVVMIVNEVANGLAGTGYGAPLVQRETITRRHVEAVAALSIATSSVLAVLTVAVASVLPASVFGARVPELLPLVAPMFLISGLTIVPRALLERELDFGRLSANDMTTMVVSTGVSVGARDRRPQRRRAAARPPRRRDHEPGDVPARGARRRGRAGTVRRCARW